MFVVEDRLTKEFWRNLLTTLCAGIPFEAYGRFVESDMCEFILVACEDDGTEAHIEFLFHNCDAEQVQMLMETVKEINAALGF